MNIVRLKNQLSEIAGTELTNALTARGINDISDILRAPDTLPGISQEDIDALRRKARFLASGLDEKQSDALNALELDSLLDVARLDRARFVEIAAERMGGPAEAASFHRGAERYTMQIGRLVGMHG